MESDGCDGYYGVVFVGCSANHLNDGPGIHFPLGWDNWERREGDQPSVIYPETSKTDWLIDYLEDALETDIAAAKNKAESLCDPPDLCKTHVQVECVGINPFVSTDFFNGNSVFMKHCGKTYSYDCEKSSWK